MIDRQKATGWVLVIVSCVYLAYFLKVQVLTHGLPLEKRDWMYLISSIVGLVLGTINIRMAGMRQRGEKYPWVK